MSLLVKAENLSKSFGQVKALENVDFTLKPGEVVGLLGDNGAGKSTLVKILSGLHRPDQGELWIKGRKIDFKRFNVRRARANGVETVYQDRALADRQPLWRNVFVGRHITGKLGFINAAREKRETMNLLSGHLGLRGAGVSPDSDVGVLSGGERQALAIARAMYFESDIIILDEPTTALSLGEADKVLHFVRRIKQARRSCIYITHDLSRLYPEADRFVCLDRGRVRTVLERKDVSLQGLADVLMALTGQGKSEIANE